MNTDPNGPGSWIPRPILGFTFTGESAPANSTPHLQDISKALSDACNNSNAKDPIILDLSGAGITTTSLSGSKYYADFTGSGFAKNTAWIGSNNGILAIQNGNTITVVNNFQALAQLDSDGNGLINSNDSAFSELRIIKADGTVSTLSALGIQSLNLATTASNTTDANGNTKLSTGSYTKTDGTTLEMSNYTLLTDPFSSIATQTLSVPNDIAALPNAIGTGNTYSLRQAMAMAMDTSGELKSLVQQFMSADTQESRYALVDSILYQWTNCENVDPTSRGCYDTRKVDVIESFAGQNGIQIDMNASGFAKETALVGQGDGILAYDKNNDGLINNGTELNFKEIKCKKVA